MALVETKLNKIPFLREVVSLSQIS